MRWTSVLIAACAAWWPCAEGVWEVEHVEKRLVLDVTFETSKGARVGPYPLHLTSPSVLTPRALAPLADYDITS